MGQVSTALDRLDPEQRVAAEITSGPVCILAGAGTGKTTTVTHRIAHAISIGVVSPDAVLAVTHSAKAAGALRDRLRRLGAGDVTARTFHAAALRQLRYFWSATERPGTLNLLDNKYPLVRRCLERGDVTIPVSEAAAKRATRASAVKGQGRSSLTTQANRRQSRIDIPNEVVFDVTAEIGWAQSQLLRPDTYASAAIASGRSLPLAAADLVVIYEAYEVAKDRDGRVDFEDLLWFTAELITTVPDVAAQIRARYRWFVVDEYQDVDPLQALLLDAWLGDGDDLCVVGDPLQSIFSFKGAQASYLVDFPQRWPGARVVHLHRDYRSTPQVATCANTLVGARPSAALVGQRPAGPPPQVRAHATESDEENAVVARIRSLAAAGVSYEEMAVLYRFNSQSARFEAALTAAGVPFHVADNERFFERPEVHAALSPFGDQARANPDALGVGILRDVLEAQGWFRDDPPAGAGAARARWESLAALLGLVEDLPGVETLGASYLLADLQRRANEAHDPTRAGVTLCTLHKAKGLEWDAVFLPGITEGSIPSVYATTPAHVAEERRLLYVGITRAREHLLMSHAAANGRGWKNKPSRFLAELAAPHSSGPTTTRRPAVSRSGSSRAASTRALVTSGGGARASDFGTCERCGDKLRGAAQRRLRRCGPACLDGATGATWKALLAWRDGVAVAEGLDPTDAVSDKALLALVSDPPSSVTAFARVRGVAVGAPEHFATLEAALH